MTEHYDEDYFLRGKETGKSLYEDYRWLPELTLPMACAIMRHLGIKWDQSVLDFGCARGYLVRALREHGIAARGYDTSEWAVENADPMVRDFVSCRWPQIRHDWVIAKDVMEHVRTIDDTVACMMSNARVGVFVVVPLANVCGEPYVVPEYEADVTHLWRWTLAKWSGVFIRSGWSVTASYRLPGVKDNYKQFPTGNGFLTCRRIAE